jgi:hypothetical protein
MAAGDPIKLSDVKARSVDEHRSETDYSVRILSDYFNVVEKALETFEPQEKKAIDEKWEKIHGRFVEATSEKIEHIVRFSEEYPKRLRYSFILQLFIALESRGKALCDEINKRNEKLLLRVSDLRGGGTLNGIKTFLSKVYPVPDVTDDQWRALDDLRVIRNCLVHKNGHIDLADKDAQRLTKIIAEEQGIDVSPDGYLGIERCYCEKALRSVIAFFEVVFEKAEFGTSYFFGRWPHDIVAIRENERVTVVRLSELPSEQQKALLEAREKFNANPPPLDLD